MSLNFFISSPCSDKQLQILERVGENVAFCYMLFKWQKRFNFVYCYRSLNSSSAIFIAAKGLSLIRFTSTNPLNWSASQRWHGWANTQQGSINIFVRMVYPYILLYMIITYLHKDFKTSLPTLNPGPNHLVSADCRSITGGLDSSCVLNPLKFNLISSQKNMRTESQLWWHSHPKH